MDIKILDSWLREYLKTKASAKQIAEYLSLASVSIEKIEQITNDYLYHIEVTTNRPDLMSVVGLAREAAAVLPQFGVTAEFIHRHPEVKPKDPKQIKNNEGILRSLNAQAQNDNEVLIAIKNDPKLVNRICAAVLDVTMKDSPSYIKDRLEKSEIRSLNNIIDVTNYVMRETGHPAHVFDLDRLTTRQLIVRESKKGEKIITLDKKVHTLAGGDIVADDGKGEIIDLLGIIGTANSVVTDKTKRILFFLDNNDPIKMRKTSMALAIRSEAVILNEKSIDPELAMKTLLRGIEIYKEVADGKLISEIIDIYPNKVKKKTITITEQKINSVIGVKIPLKTSTEILERLGFEVKTSNGSLEVTVPSYRLNDINIEEDIIEEVARIYGYHKLPTIIPNISSVLPYHFLNEFYIERRIKEALKYWGFTECYTYSMVAEELYEGPIMESITIQNPLTDDHVYMRRTIVPSLLEVVKQNQQFDELNLFELAYTYHKNKNKLPNQTLMLAGLVKKQVVSFFEVKGLLEQLLTDLGITNIIFKARKEGGEGTDLYIDREFLGDIEVLDETIINFELSFDLLKEHATLAKNYSPLPKFPPIIEDVRIIIGPKITYKNITSLIKSQSFLVKDVSLLDVYENKKTFRITYQDKNKNLTTEEVAKIREKIYKDLEKKLKAKIV